MKKALSGGGINVDESPALDGKDSRDRTPSSAQKRRTN
jgi:hypothetical protein